MPNPPSSNSDQGAQFTAQAFTEAASSGQYLNQHGWPWGRCHDNIFIERLWRSVKWEVIYLKAFEDGQHLAQEVNAWFRWYNQHRPHQSLNYQNPG